MGTTENFLEINFVLFSVCSQRILLVKKSRFVCEEDVPKRRGASKSRSETTVREISCGIAYRIGLINTGGQWYWGSLVR